MVRALESAGMDWLHEWGVEVPRTIRVVGEQNGHSVAEDMPGPWVVKPDIAMGGKGLKGLVRICETEVDLVRACHDLRGDSTLPGQPVPLLIEEFVDGSEFYASIAFDEALRSAVVRLSSDGGVGFDANLDAAAIAVDLGVGLLASDVNQLLRDSGMNSDPQVAKRLSVTLNRMWRAFVASEATLLEVNPFRVRAGLPIAVGIALEFDDNGTENAAALRPKILKGSEHYRTSALTSREQAILDINRQMQGTPAVSFIELEGDISLLVSGGGAALLAMDRLHDIGLNAACYIDSSPGAAAEKLRAMLVAGMTVPNITAVLFGAAVISLDDVSRISHEFIEAYLAAGLDPLSIPVVARVAGPNEAAAHDMFRERMPHAIVMGRESTLEDACDAVLRELDQLNVKSKANVCEATAK